MENWEGRCVYSAKFEMERLLNVPRMEGIFMINLRENDGQEFYGSRVTVAQGVVRRVDKPPGQKSLRISLSYSE